MRKLRIALLATVCLASLYGTFTIGYNVGGSTHNNPPVPTAKAPSPDQGRMWVLTNQNRTNNGLKPLELDANLTASATAKCADMVRYKYWEHTSPSGVTPQDLMTIYSPGWSYSGENLSLNADTSESVISAWMKSPHHRKNMLEPHYTKVGFAVCTDAKGQIMVVQHFTD